MKLSKGMTTHYPKVPSVGLSTWEELYRQAVEFKNVSPWRYVQEQDIFAVEDPSTGETGFCHVTGAQGQHRALSVYRGAPGLHFIMDLLRGEIPSDPSTVLLSCDKLEASFEDEETLDEKDLDIIKKLNLEFKGKLGHPMFRDFKPGCLPWFVDEKGAKFLNYALNMAYLVSMNVYAGGDTVPSPLETGRYVTFHLEKVEGEMKLKGDIRDIPSKKIKKDGVEIDELKLARLARKISSHSGIWEVGGVFSLVAISDKNRSRPYFPAILLWVDTTNEKVLVHRLSKKDEISEAVVEGTIQAIESEDRAPVEFRVFLESTYNLLQPLGAKFRSLVTITEPSPVMQGFLKFVKATIEQPEIFGGMV